MTENLDTLLSRPLPAMPDNGFSARIAAQVELQQLRRGRFLTELYAGLVVLAALVLPFTPFGRVMSAATFTISGGVLISVALTSIFLLSSLRRFHHSL